MFSPPSRDGSGCVQLCQYACWVEGVTGASVYDPQVLCHAASTPSEDTLRKSGDHLHTTIHHARRCCDALRDGRVLGVLMDKLTVDKKGENAENGVAPRGNSGGALRECSNISSSRNERGDGTKSKKSSVQTTAKMLVETLRRMEDIVGPPALPNITDVYAGKFPAIGAILYRLFHHFVVRDRFAFFPQMMRWYAKVCALYGRDDLDAAVESLDCFVDGTVWLLSLHNMSRDTPIELTTCYLRPGKDRAKVAANISFVHCLFDMHGVFCYFPSVSAFLSAADGKPNSHFLFMQAFHVFQHFRRSTVRPIAEKIQFADGSLDQRPLTARQTPHAVLSRSTAQRLSDEDDEVLPTPTDIPPALLDDTKQRKRPVATARYHDPMRESGLLLQHPKPSRTPTRRTRSTSPAIGARHRAVGAASTSRGGQEVSIGKVGAANPPPSSLPTSTATNLQQQPARCDEFAASVACTTHAGGGKLQLELMRLTFVGSASTDIDLVMEAASNTSTMKFTIPLACVERSKLCTGQAPAVVLYCNAPTPNAVPPYNDGRSCPSITLFTRCLTDAEGFYKTLEAKLSNLKHRRAPASAVAHRLTPAKARTQ